MRSFSLSWVWWVHTYNSSTWKAEARRFQVQGHAGFPDETLVLAEDSCVTGETVLTAQVLPVGSALRLLCINLVGTLVKQCSVKIVLQRWAVESSLDGSAPSTCDRVMYWYTVKSSSHAAQQALEFYRVENCSGRLSAYAVLFQSLGPLVER